MASAEMNVAKLVENAQVLLRDGRLWEAQVKYKDIIKLIKAKADVVEDFDLKKKLYDDISIHYDIVQRIEISAYAFKNSSIRVASRRFMATPNKCVVEDIFGEYLGDEVKEVHVSEIMSFTPREQIGFIHLIKEFKKKCRNLTFVYILFKKDPDVAQSIQISSLMIIKNMLAEDDINLYFDFDLKKKVATVICLSNGFIFEMPHSIQAIFDSREQSNASPLKIDIWFNSAFKQINTD